MDKVTDAELATLSILVQSVRETNTIAQRTQAAYQDYVSKLKAVYSLKDTDTVNMQSGEIIRTEAK